MKNIILLVCCITFLLTANAQEINYGMPPVIKNRIIKLDFFAPLTGNLTLGYEQPLIKSVTFTGELGIIGASLVPLTNRELGVFMKSGVKLYFSPDYYMDGMKRYNDFQGSYFNPEIIYSGFGFDYNSYNQTSGAYSTMRGVNNSIALMLQFGKQWVLAKTISIEMYGGIGYGWSSINIPGYYSGNGVFADLNSQVPDKFSHLQFSNEVPVAIDAGFNIGLLLK
jgi:hypothetical protein